MSDLVVICNDLDYFLRHRAVVPSKLAREGHRVTIVTGGRTADVAKMPPGLTFEHVTIERFSFNPFQDFLLTTKSLRLFLRMRPDAVHLITLKPAIYGGLAVLACHALGHGPQKLLITIPGLGRLMSPSSAMQGLKARMARSLVGLAFKMISSRKYSHFTFETQHDRSALISQGLIRSDNATVVQGAGVDPNVFYPSGVTHDPAQPLRVLFASRLLKAKGLEAFLLAAARHSKQSTVEFVVAGMIEPGDPDGYSTAELARNPSITFLGEVTDMASLLRAVDVVCLPTLYGEGIPRILIEAAACGVVSVATNVPGCDEIVRHGETGVLIPVGGTSTMADHIEAAIKLYSKDSALLRAHSEAALNHFRAGDYSQNAVTNRFIELLELRNVNPA